MESLQKGAIVKYRGGYYRISDARGRGTRRWANLQSIFGTYVYHKRVPVDQLQEAYAEWSERWSQSESYMCM